MQLPRIDQVITSAVAASCVGIALAEGGFAPTAYAASALILWAAVVIGLATGLVPRSEPPVAAIAAGLCLAGFAGLIALSLLWASDNGRAFEDVVRALAYLGAFVLAVVASRRGDARAWLLGLAIGLVAVGAIALLARFEPGLFGDPDADLRETLPAARGRLTYPVGYWNGLAAAMAAAVVLLTWLGASGERRGGRALAVGALPLVLLALWATDSRGGIVAAALAFAVLLAAGPDRPRLVASLGIGLGGGAALVALAGSRDELFEYPGAPPAVAEGDGMLVLTVIAIVLTGLVRYAIDRPIQGLTVSPRAARVAIPAAALATVTLIVLADPVERYDDFKAPPVGTEISEGQADLLRTGGSGRYQFWETAVDAFAGAPVGGVGSGGYGPYWLEHREFPITATRAHSLVFETLAELGIAGVALITGFFGVAAVAGVRRRLASERVAEVGPALAILGVGVAAAAVDWTWDLPAVFGVTLLAAALLTGPATLPAGGPDGPQTALGTARSRRRFAGGVSVLLVAWVSICASGLLLLADHELDSSRDAAARGDLEGAFDAANDAIDLEPWAAEPRTQLALLHERAGDLTAAREALGEAIDRSPRDYELYLLQARFEAEDSDDAASRASLERAYELNPLDPEIRRQVRRFL
jgi:O-Antigen ligase